MPFSPQESPSSKRVLETMPPNSFFAGDCQALSMTQLFDSLLTSSINSMCADKTGLRVYSPTYQSSQDNARTDPASPTFFAAEDAMDSTQHTSNASKATIPSSSAVGPSSAVRVYEVSSHNNNIHNITTIHTNPSTTSSFNQIINTRPPLPIHHHTQSSSTSTSSFRDRKPKGLSITPPEYQLPSNPQASPDPSPIYCARNVELRRKSLSERHFFRPVSEDDDSTIAP